MNLQGKLINDRFQLVEQIGKGSFGVVWKAWDQRKKQPVAVKLESKSAKKHLENEFQIYKKLQAKEFDGFTKCFYYGPCLNNTYNAMVLQYLGPSLSSLFGWCKKNLTLETICNIAIQLTYRLECFHSIGYLHQDLKPENITIGTKYGNDQDTIYLIDFGTSVRFKSANNVHINPGNSDRIMGTCRYAAIRMHFGHYQSRRDDLESLCYVLLYLFYRKLPWQDVKDKNPRKKWKIVREMKRNKMLKNKWPFEDAPTAFLDYHRYIHSLGFYTKPNYRIIRGIFRRLQKQLLGNDKNIPPFCWSKKKRYLKHESSKNQRAPKF